QTLLLFRSTVSRRALDIQRTLGANLRVFGARLVKKGKALTISWPKGAKDHALVGYTEAMLRARAAMAEEVQALEAMIKAFAHADPVCCRLMTMPGVGPITSATFRSAIDDPARFASSRDVGAYFGLTPRRVQSGRSDFQGAISRAGS